MSIVFEVRQVSTNQTIIKCVSIDVISEHRQLFIDATTENGNKTRQEPGNIRFDILCSAENPNRFFLYEAYASEDAIAAHKKTDYYQKWREVAEPLMAQPRETREFYIIEPKDFKKV